MDHGPQKEPIARKQLVTNSPINQCQTGVCPSRVFFCPPPISMPYPESSMEHQILESVGKSSSPPSLHFISELSITLILSVACQFPDMVGHHVELQRPSQGPYSSSCLSLGLGLWGSLSLACRMAPNGPTEVYGRISFFPFSYCTPSLIRTVSQRRV
jgi:hypothetical protein